jgi:hypothetical protein
LTENRSGDKAKIKRAIKAGVLPEAEKSPSLKKLDWSQLNPSPRTTVTSTKPLVASSSSSQFSISAGASSTQNNASANRRSDTMATQPWREEEDIFAGGDDSLMVDELFVKVPTQVVGIQYYKGTLLLLLTY